MKEIVEEIRLLLFLKILQISMYLLPKNHPESNIIMKAYHDLLLELFKKMEE